MLKRNILFIILMMSFVFPVISAATTLNTPIAYGNYTTLTVNCTTALVNNHNVTIYYNASGGAASTSASSLITITNTSAAQTEFTSSPSIEALADGISYNFTCYAANSTDQQYSVGVANVRIDNTVPTSTTTLLKSTINEHRTQEITWTTADATSGVSSNNATLISPKPDVCPTQNWTTLTGTNIQITETRCVGTWTVYITPTDHASNTATASSTTFEVTHAGSKMGPSGSGGISAGSFSIFGEQGEAKLNKNFVVLILIVLGILFLARKNR